MSHTTTIELEVKNIAALKQACVDLGFSYQENAVGQLYDGTKVEGFVMTLPGFSYPVIAAKGKLHFDTYKGQWGDEQYIAKLKQRYMVNVQKDQARARGYRVREERLGEKFKLVLER